jgi:hypothetical protein
MGIERVRHHSETTRQPNVFVIIPKLHGNRTCPSSFRNHTETERVCHHSETTQATERVRHHSETTRKPHENRTCPSSFRFCQELNTFLEPHRNRMCPSSFKIKCGTTSSTPSNSTTYSVFDTGRRVPSWHLSW